MATTILCLIVAFGAQSLVVVYPGVFVFWFTFHTRIEHWRSMGKGAYAYTALGWPLIGGTVLWFRESIFRVVWPRPWWMILAGVLALLVAIRVGSQAARTIPRQTLIGLVELEPQHNLQPLLASGIYAKTRNPIYLTHWLIILAAAAISGYAANWIFAGIDSVLTALLMRVEEKELLARYGREFEDYMRRVPRFFPRLT